MDQFAREDPFYMSRESGSEALQKTGRLEDRVRNLEIQFSNIQQLFTAMQVAAQEAKYRQ